MEIHAGNFIRVVGFNRCGKTTLFQILSGEYSEEKEGSMDHHSKTMKIVSMEAIPYYYESTIKDLIDAHCDRTQADKESLRWRICDDLGIPQALEGKTISLLNTAMLQRLAIALLFLKCPPGDHPKSPSIIILDGALSHIEPKRDILRKLVEAYLKTAFIYADYGAL
jgi:translation initiation factor RLI1